LGANGWGNLVRRSSGSGGKVNRNDCAGLAAEMSYHLIVSLIPLFLFLTSLSGLIGGQKEIYPMIQDFIQRFAPAPSIALLNETMDAVIHGSSTGLTTIGFIGTLWSASGAAGIVVKGLQRSYGLAGRPFPIWYGPWLAIAVVLSLGVITVSATYLIMFGNMLFNWLTSVWQISGHWEGIFTALRWAIVILGIRYGVAFAYTLTLRPQVHHFAWKEARTGSWFFVIAWLTGSWLFSLYLSHLPQFNPVYGSLGVLIILVTWFYYSSFVFFIGGEVTALRVGLTDKSEALPT
jgi:membrane protein